MNHLVRHHPVVVEVLLRRVLAHMDTRERGKSRNIAPRCAAAHAAPVLNKLYENALALHRKSPVIGAHSPRGIFNPLENRIRRQINYAVAEIDLNRRTTHADRPRRSHRLPPRRNSVLRLRARRQKRRHRRCKEQAAEPPPVVGRATTSIFQSSAPRS